MAQPIEELLNRIRWNEEYLSYKYEVSYIPDGMKKIVLIDFAEMEFGEKDTEGFKLKSSGRFGDWIPFDSVIDVYKNGLLLWHKEGVPETYYSQEGIE